MPLPDRKRAETPYIAILDHVNNPEHPIPWRVDGQLGVSPSRCIAGAWRLSAGETTTSRYCLLMGVGTPDTRMLEASWGAYRKNFPS